VCASIDNLWTQFVPRYTNFFGRETLSLFKLTCLTRFRGPSMHPADIEKAHGSPSMHSVTPFELESTHTESSHDAVLELKSQSKLERWLSRFNVEIHGVERIPVNEREPVTASSSLHMFLMWFSMALATNNIIVGSLGTFLMGLSFKDAALCAVFGNLTGVVIVGYMSTWGPQSGNRTLVSCSALLFLGAFSHLCRSSVGTLWATIPAKSAVR